MQEMEKPDFRPQFRIAVIAPPEYGFGRGIMEGISNYCARARLWPVAFDPQYRPIPDVRKWQVDGVIATLADAQMARQVRTWKLPAINVSSKLHISDFPLVEIDNEMAGRQAAEHLIERNLPHYASLALQKFRFSELRVRGFEQALKERGHKEPFKLMENIPNQFVIVRRWIEDLPHPIGIMVCTDQWASWTIEACRLAGLSIPETVSLVSVDNDKLICLLNEPQLSSVVPDFEQVGYTAAAQLHAWIATGQTPPPHTRIPPRGVVVRRSSDLVATEDPVVRKALGLIRERAPYGLTVEQLLDGLAVSRRNLEYHFQEAIRSTPATEIRRVQIERACQLLIDTDLSLDDVAGACGMGYQRQLRMLFHRDLKTTPTAFRARFRPGH
jgi:LacI family transcriptional regulator